MTLYLIHWFPYLNRQILRLETIEEYLTYSKESLGASDYQIVEDVNFNPADGVETKIVVNAEGWGSENWDYILLLTSDGNISSRWYIVEATRTRRGQYSATLRRDLVADFLPLSLSSEWYIEKSKLPASSPLIYQSEGQVLNQIKKSETLLPDSTGCAWLVGYISKDTATGSLTGSIPTDESTANITLSSSIEDWDLYKYASEDCMIANSIKVTFESFQACNIGGWVNVKQTYDALGGTLATTTIQLAANTTTSLILDGSTSYTANATQPDYNATGLITSIGEAIATGRGFADTTTAAAVKDFLDAKIVVDGDGNYYQVKAHLTSNSTQTISNWINYEAEDERNAWSLCVEAAENCGETWSSLPTSETVDGSFTDEETYLAYRLTITPLTDQGASFDLTGFNNVETMDSAYQVIGIPYPLSGSLVVQCGTSDEETKVTYTRVITTEFTPTSSGGMYVDVSTPENATLVSASLTGATYGAGISLNATARLSPTLVRVAFVLYNADYIIANNKTLILYTSWQYTTTEKSGVVLTSNEITQESSLRFAQAISKQLASYSYDWQLLPYCPAPQYISNEGDDVLFIDLSAIHNLDDTELAGGTAKSFYRLGVATDSDGNLANVALLAPTCNLSFDINVNVAMEETEDADEAENIKIATESDIYRLVSPNYNGDFDFSVAKNGGSVSHFTADVSFKPYSPYIHVAPLFSGLYGTDYNDARGLTCGGDFSIDQTSDRWADYVIQNKNYSAIFDRQIQHMDFNRGLERINDVFGAASSAFSTGSFVGGVTGSAGLGVAAGVASAIGGIADYAIKEAQYSESKKYAKDQYNLQLGNIQALPYALAKVGSYNPNAKLVPFLERFSPTTEERAAFLKKIRRDGMATGIISTLEAYYSGTASNYTKASLVRINADGFTAGNHEIMTLAAELEKGVYL